MSARIETWGRKYLVGRRVSPQAHQHMQDSLLEEAELDSDCFVFQVSEVKEVTRESSEPSAMGENLQPDYSE